MDALELNFNQENFCAGYALMGEDEALKSYVKDKFLETIPVDERGFAYVVVDINSSKNVEDIIQAADMFCFASCKKMIYIEPISTKLDAKSVNKLKEYFSNPNPTAFVVFEDIGNNDFSSFNNFEAVCCAKASEAQLAKYVTKKVVEKGYKMDGYTVNGFVRYCCSNFGKIDTELSKLMLYTMETKVIKKEDYELLTAPDLELNVYKLTNQLCRKNYSEALKILSKLQEEGISDRIIFKTMQTTYKRLFYIACSSSSDQVISKSLGLSASAISVNRGIINDNRNNKSFISSLKKIVDYMFYLEDKMLQFVVSETNVINLAIDRIIELMEVKTVDRK